MNLHEEPRRTTRRLREQAWMEGSEMESFNSQTRVKLFLGLGLIIVILAVVIGAAT